MYIRKKNGIIAPEREKASSNSTLTSSARRAVLDELTRKHPVIFSERSLYGLPFLATQQGKRVAKYSRGIPGTSEIMPRDQKADKIGSHMSYFIDHIQQLPENFIP